MKLKRTMYGCASAAIVTVVVGGLMARPAEAEERPEVGEYGVSNSPVTADDSGRHGPTVLHTTDMEELGRDGHPALSPTDVVTELFGGILPGKVSAAAAIGHVRAVGIFSGGNSQAPVPADGLPGPIGIADGAIISSGDIFDARGGGPWPAWNLRDWMSTAWGLPGDADLDAEKYPGVTVDAAGITFTVTIAPNTPQRFHCEYVFGSEEYNEYVPGLPFNDITGIFVDGVNIARTPPWCGGPAGPVSIYNLNGGNPFPGFWPPNRFCYRNWPLSLTNDRWPAPPLAAPFLEFELDGSTRVLQTRKILLTADPLDPVEHTVKLVIADNYDPIFDSKLFVICSLQAHAGRCIRRPVDPPFGCECQNVAAAGECTGPDATFEASMSCEDPGAPCTGACCEGYGTCAITTESDCEAGDGSYQGEATTCAGDLGSCSTGGGCIPTLEECCIPVDWDSEGTCPAPVGACCLNTGQCTEGTASACSGAGGEYQGDGSACLPLLCSAHNIPTVSEWGLMVVTLLAMTLGTILLARRREKRMSGMA